MDEFVELYKKYEKLFGEMYGEVLDRFYEESYLRAKLNKDCNGDISIKLNDGNEKSLRKIEFEEVKERLFEMWENAKENKKATLDSEDVMKEIINSVTLYFIAREVRKVMAHSKAS